MGSNPTGPTIYILLDEPATPASLPLPKEFETFTFADISLRKNLKVFRSLKLKVLLIKKHE
ncbi:MAG: hypothetical protein QXS10_06670 [Candidatus Bathyarchaeia archaeon]